MQMQFTGNIGSREHIAWDWRDDYENFVWQIFDFFNKQLQGEDKSIIQMEIKRY